MVIRASLADPPAFEAIFDRHWGSVHRYCLRRAGPPGEDVAAETFRIAFDQRVHYDGRGEARPWLFGIASNLLRELFRRSTRAESARRRLGARPSPAEDDPFEAALGRIEAEQLGPELAAALRGLSALDRETLLLFACAELGYAEIARAMAVPVGTVRSRIHRARTQLRGHLDTTHHLDTPLETCP